MNVSELGYPYLARLESISRRLRTLGTGIAIGTVLVIICSVLALSGFPDRLPIVILVFGFASTNVIFLVLFDMHRKQGSALFQEISDELQLGLGLERPRKSADRSSIPMEARVGLRLFRQYESLPIVPGNLGIALYVVINLAAVILLCIPYVHSFR